MTFTDAAQEVLKQSGRPLHYKEITELAIESNLLSHVGKSPEVTMGARLAATLKKTGEDNPLVRVKPGVFALREWDEETIKKGLEIKRTARKKKDDDKTSKKEDKKGAKKSEKKDDDERAKKESKKGAKGDEEDKTRTKETEDKPSKKETQSNEEDEASDSDTSTKQPDVEATPQSADEKTRAAIAKSASEVFAEEEDDDQPILKESPEEEEGDKDGDKDEDKDEKSGKRRRRRRRRRGSKSSDKSDKTEKSSPGSESDGMPSYTAKPAEAPEALPRGPQVIELSADDVPALDDLAGKPLADAVVAVLSTFDRTVGAVSLRQIAETAQRNGKLSGDAQVVQSQIAAAVRADNARRDERGLRPRFRIAGGRVGLTEWLLDGEVARSEREVNQTLERHRSAIKKALTKKVTDLPGHAFVELCLLALERMGVTALTPVKFPGASGSEAHFAATLPSPAGERDKQVGSGEGIPLAVVIRKDGRDLGRERVTELRGSAHHYQGAKIGWVFTSGQLLSGAKEEVTADGVMPVTVLDAASVAQLCQEHGVGVIRVDNPVYLPDVDLFEALRSS